jgi:hypothetical protein
MLVLQIQVSVGETQLTQTVSATSALAGAHPSKCRLQLVKLNSHKLRMQPALLQLLNHQKQAAVGGFGFDSRQLPAQSYSAKG